MMYVKSLIEEKMKVFSACEVLGTPDYYGVYGVWTYCKILNKERINLEEKKLINDTMKFLLTTSKTSIWERNVRMKINADMEKCKDIIIRTFYELEKSGAIPAFIPKEFNKKGLIAVLSYEYEI